MINKTIIHQANHHSGTMHLEHDPKQHDAIYLHISAGGFNFCTSLTATASRQMAEALMKAAYAIEAQQPEEMA